MPENCRHWQGLLAEHILASRGRPAGAEPAMDGDLADHLAGCSECQATAAEFRSVADALAHTAPTAAHVVTPASTALSTRITARVDLERQRRDRRRRFAGVIAAAAAAAIVVVVSVVAIRHRESPETAGERIEFSTPEVHGGATLQARSWGTQINLELAGFTPGERYSVWLERADGSRVGAGTFTGVRDTQITVALSSALASSEAIAIGISEAGGDTVVRAALK